MSEYIGWLDEDHAPVVDMAQEVVRCRDCRFFEVDTYLTGGRVKHCGHWVSFGFWDSDNFCSWGERIES